MNLLSISENLISRLSFYSFKLAIVYCLDDTLTFLDQCFKIALLQRSFVIFFYFIDDLTFTTEKIYYGCMTKNADGTNKIIGTNDKCPTPTDNRFWKHP